MEEVDKFGSNMYAENWISSPLTKGLFKEPLEPINPFKIISPAYRRYMKKKLGLNRNAKVNIEDLVDFFKYFQMNYTVESAFCAGWIRGTSKNAEGIDSNCLLCLDVSLILTFANLSRYSETAHSLLDRIAKNGTTSGSIFQ
jgi:hypothetical protein